MFRKVNFNANTSSWLKFKFWKITRKQQLQVYEIFYTENTKKYKIRKIIIKHETIYTFGAPKLEYLHK